MRRFTGWHISGIIAAFFGIVMAVNFLMATLAVKTFGGTVVDDSFAAGQQFNKWLTQARSQKEEGWDAAIELSPSRKVHVVLRRPEGDTTALRLTGAAITPLGRSTERSLTFAEDGDAFVTTEPLPPGRWLVRIDVKDARGRHARFAEDLDDR